MTTVNVRPPVSKSVAVYPMNGINLFTGYGRMEAALIKALQAIGYDVHIGWNQPGEVAIFVGSPKWVEKINPPDARVWLYTMSESTRTSQEWVEAINAHVEHVLVPCPDLVTYYRESGVNVPVHSVPLGVDWTMPPLPERNSRPETFTWLTYSLGDMRKGVEMAIFAFLRNFKGDLRHKLVIKCRDNPQWLGGLVDDQISLIGGQQSEAEWYSTLAAAQAFIFPSRGEGFGLPPREAVLAGLPTVATEWLGMWDVAQWGYPIPVNELWPVQFIDYEANGETGQWAQPDAWEYQSPLDVAMRQIVTDYPTALKTAGQGRDYLLKYFTWECTARLISTLIVAEAHR